MIIPLRLFFIKLIIKLLSSRSYLTSQRHKFLLSPALCCTSRRRSWLLQIRCRHCLSVAEQHRLAQQAEVFSRTGIEGEQEAASTALKIEALGGSIIQQISEISKIILFQIRQ